MTTAACAAGTGADVTSDAARTWSWRRGGATVAVARDLVAAIGDLTADERCSLGRLDLADSRRASWVRGRNLVRAFLPPGVSVIADERGAPCTTGWSVGFAHDGRWDAAIVAPCRPAVVDVVAGGRARAVAALRRVRVTSDAEPAETWAALECALKVAGGHIASLLDLDVEVIVTSDGLEVVGVGRPVVIQVVPVEDITVAWATGGIL